MDKKRKKDKNDKALGIGDKNDKSAYKSGKFFDKLGDVAKEDRRIKEVKRRYKETGKAEDSGLHNNVSGKRWKT